MLRLELEDVPQRKCVDETLGPAIRVRHVVNELELIDLLESVACDCPVAP